MRAGESKVAADKGIGYGSRATWPPERVGHRVAGEIVAEGIFVEKPPRFCVEHPFEGRSRIVDIKILGHNHQFVAT